MQNDQPRLKKFVKIFFALSGALLLVGGISSCNNQKNSKPGTSGEAASIEASEGVKGDVQTSVALPAFKITKSQFENHFDIKNPSKILLQVGFTNISDPSTMQLFAYDASSHSEYAKNKEPIALGTDGMGSEMVSDVIIGNYELNFKNIRIELRPGGTWANFSHIRLEPYAKSLENGKKYLVFKTTVVRNSRAEGQGAKAMGTDTIKTTIPPDTKPSPPAPPEY